MRLFGLGPTELMIILAILLLLFGPKQIPKLSKMLGRAVKDVREGFEAKDEEEEPAAPPVITAAPSEQVETTKVKETEETPS